MSDIAGPWNPPDRPWTLSDIAQALGLNLRATDNLFRDPDAENILPVSFGLAGNARLWWPETVQLALPKLRAFIEAGPAREVTKAAMRAAAEAERREREQAAKAAPAPTWRDPADDARRLAQSAPPGFVRVGGDEPKRKRRVVVDGNGYMGFKE